MLVDETLNSSQTPTAFFAVPVYNLDNGTSSYNAGIGDNPSEACLALRRTRAMIAQQVEVTYTCRTVGTLSVLHKAGRKAL